MTHLAPAIARILGQIDPELPIRDIRTIDELVATTLSQQRSSMWLFAALAGLAFLLASVGIYAPRSRRVGTAGRGAGTIERILCSRTLSGSDQLKRLLRLLVERTPSGQPELLKKYDLGLEVFQRPPDYDPKVDPIFATFVCLRK